MELKPIFSIITYIAGATFVLVDIGGDYFLIRKHYNGFERGEESLFIFFLLLTGLFILLGGLLQFGVAVFLTCKGEQDGPFKSLPVLIRILVIVTAPFLLSPFILNIYGAYTVIRYGQDN